MLRSNLCDYSDAYVVVNGNITLTKTNGREVIDIKSRFLAFKNNAPFIKCISKINNVLTDSAEDLDVTMPMYNLLEYSKNYKKQQEVCGIIAKMNLMILLLIIIMQMPQQIPSLLNTKAVL